MKKLLPFLILCLVLFPVTANVRDSLSVAVVDSVFIDTLPDSLFLAMSNRDYEKAYRFVRELDQRESLADSTLFNCAKCIMQVKKYNECLEFCAKWEKKLSEDNYESMLTPLKAECYFYQKDYNNAEKYLSQYESILNENGCKLSGYYLGLYSTVLYKLYRYIEADRTFDQFFRESLAEEGLQIDEVYMSVNNGYMGVKLYDYAYNSFFMGDEIKGMKLLYLSSLCGYKWASQDYSHLNKCATILMDVKRDIKNNVINQFVKYVDIYDFRYNYDPNSSANVAEDFWNCLLKENESYLQLQDKMTQEPKRKMLQKALYTLAKSKADIQYFLQEKCRPYRVGEIETSLVNQLVGGNKKALADFRIYPADNSNAFATPYGHIYLTSGIVLKYHFNNSLLIGICAHEMTHCLCQHSLVNLWKQYEKERRNRIIGGIAAGIYATTMAVSAGYGGSRGNYDRVFNDSLNLFTVISDASYYFQFKYSRLQEIESDLVAYRFCEALGIGGYAYIMALQLLDDNDMYMKADKSSNHPTLSYRISFLKWLYDREHRKKEIILN